MKLGRYLKNYRIESGLSQSEVAAHLHISRQAISQWENGKSYPDLDNLTMISKLYGIDLNELLVEDFQVRETITEVGHKLKLNTEKNKSTFDEGLILILLSCVTFITTPLGLLVVPLVVFKNNKQNSFYKIIYFMCVIAFIYNLIAGYKIILKMLYG